MIFFKKPFYWLKHAYQRVKKGYSYRDLWNIDFWFLKIMPNMLEDFTKDLYGYPATIREELKKKNPELTDEEIDEKNLDFQYWKDIVKEIAFHFREASEEENEAKTNQYWEKMYELQGKYNLFLPDEKEVKQTMTKEDFEEWKTNDEKWLDREKEIENYRNEQLKIGMEMFTKYFWSLWD